MLKCPALGSPAHTSPPRPSGQCQDRSRRRQDGVRNALAAARAAYNEIMAFPAASLVRSVVGEPLRSDRLDETLLAKRLALPVFCSDPLSSVAYATEQILLVLGLGGLALLHPTGRVAAAVG